MTNLYKIIMFLVVVIGSLMAISSRTWLGMWVGMEINLLAIIPLFNNTENKLASESAIKYLIIQVLASALFLLAILMLYVNNSSPFIFIDTGVLLMILNTSLLTKMGAAPFHFWFPEIVEGLNWMNCLMLMTWQKLAPMAIMSYNIKPSLFMSIIIITSMIVSGIMGISQTSMRKILAYSSINHIAWMIGSIMLNLAIWLLYFIIYMIISISIIFMLNSLQIYSISQLITSMINDPTIKILFILNFLSLGGLPPFLGFMPKWMTIQALINNQLIHLTFVMIMLTLITLYFYSRLTFSSLIYKINEPKWFKYSLKNSLIIAVNFITLSGLMFITLMFNSF
uniref:NADH-ubiquinone oxidoreductase chain 2 n=1 Tax=Ptilodactylidae sp. 3 ACP-2013 TaxID=1434564 RepID=A0A3G3FXN4_9COLE|nr:NADH dehydrogenase subunit 2 [Ptilodactylidae sp. 3 ACP-2013]